MLSCTRTNPVVGGLLLLHSLCCMTVFHLFINICYTKDNKAVIILQTRDSHAYILRTILCYSSECHFEAAVFLQLGSQALSVHGSRYFILILRIYILLNYILCFLKEMPSASCLSKAAILRIRLVLNKLFRINVDVEKTHISMRQSLGNMHKYDSGVLCLLIRLLGHGLLSGDLEALRNILEDTQNT